MCVTHGMPLRVLSKGVNNNNNYSTFRFRTVPEGFTDCKIDDVRRSRRFLTDAIAGRRTLVEAYGKKRNENERTKTPVNAEDGPEDVGRPCGAIVSGEELATTSTAAAAAAAATRTFTIRSRAPLDRWATSSFFNTVVRIVEPSGVSRFV